LHALLWGSVHTVLHLGVTDLHARVIGSVEALAAVAFLVVHAARGEWRPDLLVYATGVLLVAVHGSPAESPVGAASAA
jgi:hypothetical protein